MVISEEEVAALRADLERLQREVRAIKAANREYKAELEWFLSENVEMPMLSLLEGPQQSAPTAVALPAAAPTAEAMTAPISSPILLPLMLRWSGRLESSR